MSLAVGMAVVAVFTLQSFAAPDVSKIAEQPNFAQDFTGTLTVKEGQVTINGNAAQTGATVMTGSTVATSSKGEAIIDLGTLGRVEVGEGTTVTVTCVAGFLEVRSNCSRTEVEVKRGTVEVKSPKTETLTAGKKETYDGSVDFTSTGGVDVKVECEGRKGAWFTPGLLGLLALIGIGAGVAIGVKLGEGDIIPPSSPIR